MCSIAPTIGSQYQTHWNLRVPVPRGCTHSGQSSLAPGASSTPCHSLYSAAALLWAFPGSFCWTTASELSVGVKEGKAALVGCCGSDGTQACST